MAIRKILTMEQPVLRTRAKKVSRFDAYLEKLVHDMWETMYEAPGVGLAAPQIGESIRVLVAEFEENHVALVNPEITKRSDEMLLGTEGCLSIPGLVGEDVPRHAEITVKGRDPKGKEIRLKAGGWWARVLQHEIDHLDGVLYIDRIPKEQVRAVQPDEIADEAEIHHENVRETSAGERVPVKRAADAVAGSGAVSSGVNSGKNGTKAKNGKGGNGEIAASEQPKERVGKAGGR